MRKKQTEESKLLHDVIDYLRKCGIFHVRINTQGQYDARIGAYRPSPYTTCGCADLLVVSETHPVFVELKAKRGRLSPDQILFKAQCDMHGIEYEVVRSLDYFMNLGFKK